MKSIAQHLGVDEKLVVDGRWRDEQWEVFNEYTGYGYHDIDPRLSNQPKDYYQTCQHLSRERAGV